MPTSSTVLKSYFETGDFPTQAQFAAFIDSYENLEDNMLYVGADKGVISVSPATQGTAVVLTKKLNVIVTSQAVTGAVKLPAAVGGREIIVSLVDDDTVFIYPQTGETISVYGVNGNTQIQKDEVLVFQCITDGTWLVTSNLKSPQHVKTYRARILPVDAMPPTIDIITNTFGFPIVGSYAGVGLVYLTLAGAFSNQKTKISALCGTDGANKIVLGQADVSGDFVKMQSLNNAFSPVNGSYYTVEINVTEE